MCPVPCALCQRDGVNLTRHHLIPKRRHRNKKVRKQFSREERNQTVLLCRPCHSQVHVIFSEKELSDFYNSLESIAQHPQMQEFISFIARQRNDFKPKFSRGGRKWFKRLRT